MAEENEEDVGRGEVTRRGIGAQHYPIVVDSQNYHDISHLISSFYAFH